MNSIFPDASAGRPRTRIIAHRGACGYLPEHTIAAKALAYGLGADFLEQDVIATRDGRPVVLHDIALDDISDVALHWPDRARPDGHFYTIDFTLEEIRQLSLIERRRPGAQERLYPARYPFDSPVFHPVTLEEEIDLVSGLNAATGRQVGLYPEIKEPGWHARHGIDLTRLVHDTLERSRERILGPVFVQSFDATELERLRTELGSDWPRVQLLDEPAALALVGDDSRLAAIESYARGIGLPFTTLLRSEGARLRPSPLAERLAASRLLIHPYTLRRDLPPPDGIDYFEALRFLIVELGVDALFCDHPDDAIAIRDGRRSEMAGGSDA